MKKVLIILGSLLGFVSAVRWGMVGNSPFPYNIVCMLLNMKSLIAKDFDEGLTTLKSQLES